LPHVLWLQTSSPYWGGLRCYHVFYSSEPRLLAGVGSGTATCPIAPNLASRLRWAPTLPCVIWLRISPPTEVGTDTATCPMALELTFRLRCAPALPRVPRVPMGHELQNIKKSLAGLPVQLGTHVSNARAHVSKAPQIRAITRLQDA
jgi:hypothetical protein